MDALAYYYMPLFRPGAVVTHGMSRETVSHIVVRRNEMVVYLVGREAPVDPDALMLEPTAFHTARVPDRF